MLAPAFPLDGKGVYLQKTSKGLLKCQPPRPLNPNRAYSYRLETPSRTQLPILDVHTAHRLSLPLFSNSSHYLFLC
ncbi:hypothetical protein K439DRAFT_1641662 [Ramaria rubella]|nr:hypothetical protein K439DRAFT_1641662 [Ramaria rubella]